MLTLNDVACRRDGTLLFERASLVIHAEQKVGLTGANGTGKSSLFAMIRGVLEPDTGEILLPRHVGITHVAQETPGTARAAIEHVIDGDERVRALEAAIDACGDDDGVQHATLLGELDEAGGWTVRSRAGALLNGLGFADAVHGEPVSSFSGGWRMRLNLAQALISPAELLLLDEPTNHLDLDAVLWLEEWLKKREGTLLLISHDREFLDAVTTHTLHIEKGSMTLATGGYSSFERQRAARLQTQQATHVKQEARRKELQSFVDRFRAKATKARQAQSRLKMLERLGDVEAVRPDSAFQFSFLAPEAMPSPLVSLDRVTVGYGGEPVLEDVRFTVQAGDRIGLLGANGAGKSTLVKTLVGELDLVGGTRTPARKLTIGYFAQHQVDRLRAEHSPLQALLKDDPSLTEGQARSFLGGFGFAGDRALQQAATLSGGERARLALALIVHARPNLLLLDEPTNHLDIDMRQALADALQVFEGALLVISHDRVMLRSVVDSLWLVSDRGVGQFDDDLDGYARWLAARRNDSCGSHAVASGGTDAVADPGVGATRQSTGEEVVRPSRKAGREAQSGKASKDASAEGTGESGHAASANGLAGGKAHRQADAQANGPANGKANGHASGHASGRADGKASGPGDAGESAAERKRRRRDEASRRGQLTPLRKQVAREEKALAAATLRLGELRERLTEPALYGDDERSKLAGLLEEEGVARQAVESIEESLLIAMESLEQAETTAGDPAP